MWFLFSYKYLHENSQASENNASFFQSFIAPKLSFFKTRFIDVSNLILPLTPDWYHKNDKDTSEEKANLLLVLTLTNLSDLQQVNNNSLGPFSRNVRGEISLPPKKKSSPKDVSPLDRDNTSVRCLGISITINFLRSYISGDIRQVKCFFDLLFFKKQGGGFFAKGKCFCWEKVVKLLVLRSEWIGSGSVKKIFGRPAQQMGK